ncbi:MAG: MBL fold metallo-hydrolase [bacterium]
MKLTFLGTGTSQGVPVIACGCRVCRSADGRDSRLRTSAMLETYAGKRILFDIGPDFRQQMLRHDVKSIDAILVTHAHRDHVAGLDDVRAFNYVQHKKMDVYLNQEAKAAVLEAYDYIFAYHQYPGLPEVDLHVVGDAPFEAAGETVVPIRAMHKDLPVLGYRVGEMAYVTDANYIAPDELDKMKGVKVLVINALRREKHFSHFSLPEALEVIGKVAPERAFLTHISHEFGTHAEVEAELPEGVAPAYDNLEIAI